MQSRSWVTVLILVFITVTALVAADLLSQHIRARATPPPQTTPLAPSAAASTAPAVTEQQAVSGTVPLLGTADDVTKEKPKPVATEKPNGVPSVPPPVNVPEPSQSMTLVGTIVSPGNSMAWVMTGGREMVVRENDELASFRVAEIGDHSITLEMSGQRKTLYMPSFQASVPIPPSSNAPGPGVLPPPPPATVSGPPAGPAPEGGKATLSDADRQKAMANLDMTLKELRIIPEKKNGVDYGSKVVYLVPGSFLSKAGLAQGDILLTVNNKPVTNASQGLEVFQAFQYESKIVLKIDRGGKVINQEVEFR